jgi:hypothetical protein
MTNLCHLTSLPLDIKIANLSVFGTNEISEGLWLFEVVVFVSVCIMTVVIVSMGIFCWANIVHLQDVATFRASFDRAIAGHL